MASSFHNLYLPSADRQSLIETLQASLTELGYTTFDPFGLIPGKSYPQAVRVFVAPVANGWLRVIGEIDAQLLPLISQRGVVLSVGLTGAEANISVYNNGALAGVNALRPYLLEVGSVEDLQNALEGKGDASLRFYQANTSLPTDILSGDLKSLAGQVDMKQADSMFSRLSGQLMKKTGGDKQEASDMLKSGVEWDSAGGKRIRAFMACLSVPQDWQTPDFVALRDAYQLLLRRKILPNARLYPGDAEAMELVPNALDYTPVYAGRM